MDKADHPCPQGADSLIGKMDSNPANWSPLVTSSLMKSQAGRGREGPEGSAFETVVREVPCKGVTLDKALHEERKNMGEGCSRQREQQAKALRGEWC